MFGLLKSLINIVFSIVEFLLGIRLLLKLFGANAGAPFVRWIYDTTAPLLEPFRGAFSSPVLEGRYVLEFNTLFALIIYLLVSYLLLEFLEFVRRSSQVHRA
ncbi:MAG TPA: hypothetical protein DCX32_03140 [Candidatus Moranbacteria bacterium]|nr:MAG: hypothetical protein UW87_C0003G0019 [Candidatus Moranbacteria bacterium GW2011_GWC2_45_10]HAV11514.1 hypothetical protein [Candidatus Moranbacteria bacterium]